MLEGLLEAVCRTVYPLGGGPSMSTPNDNTRSFRPDQEEVLEVEVLAKVSRKDRVWDLHRSSCQWLAHIYQGAEEHPKLIKRASRMDACSPELFFDLVQEETGVRYQLANAHFCHVRTCPVCQWRKSLRHKARFLEAMKRLLPKIGTEVKWVFLTLTVRNCDISQLRETIKGMNEAWDRLQRSMSKKSDWWLGWVLSTEVTFSPSEAGNSHPHFHVLIAVKPSYFHWRNYLKHEAWMALWKRSARLDYDPTVQIQSIRSKCTDGDEVSSRLKNAVAETLKYAVKPDRTLQEEEPLWLQEYALQVDKLKFVRTGGILRGILKNDYSDEELVEGEGEEETAPAFARKRFDYAVSEERYQRRKRPGEAT